MKALTSMAVLLMACAAYAAYAEEESKEPKQAEESQAAEEPQPAKESQAARELKAFPPAEAGMVRFVLILPKKEDERGLKVELIVGKTVETDEVNRHFFGGKIEEVSIEGWGYPKFVVNKLGPMAGTLIAVDPAAPKAARFVTLGGDPHLIRYNSRLPVVLYLPEGAEARYRIWRAGPKARTMKAG